MIIFDRYLHAQTEDERSSNAFDTMILFHDAFGVCVSNFIYAWI